MNDSRDRFGRWIDCLLDPSRSPGDQRQAAQEWCEWGLDLLGVDENELATRPDAFSADCRLPIGKAISPLGAARCVREYRRTAVFLQAMDAALRCARKRFPGERIHVLEAGCGPLAPLALPFALRYPPDEVIFSLLDLHPIAIEGTRRMARELGVRESVRGYLAADATTIQFSEPDRPHVIACEVLLRALKSEPQVAATRNLAPQLRRGGIFLPERIDVDAGLFDQAKWTRALTSPMKEGEEGLSPIQELGRVFGLDASAVNELQPRGAGRFAATAVNVPPHDPERTPLHLFTRIRVFGDHRLGDFDSSLNLPERVKYPAALAVKGGLVEFYYEVSADPGLRLVGLTASGSNR
ncbi:MAG: class I SAM-dependent methyltransferase [Opitutaceae bacterium]|nr:class I SAM-dependent methyltransferase [Opitutaceae bacterium]